MRARLTWCLLSALALTLGCPPEKEKDADPGTAATGGAATGNGDKPADTAPGDQASGQQAAADPEGGPQQAHPDCVGAIEAAGAKEERVVGERKVEITGAVATLTPADDDDEFTLGQLTDVKDFTPENERNLQIAVDWFKAEKVDAVAVTGDLGESTESIEKVLDLVAKLGVPVLAIAGNRECRAHFSEALAKASAKHPNVINMNKVRVFNADDASIVSLPGYYNRSYIHCAEGCEYFPSDVKALDEAAKLTTAASRVLISHGPPKMEGETGLDRIHEEVNVGDPELAKYLAGGQFPFGLFGNIQEAGGYGTDLSGKTRVKQDVWAEQLYVNPGPIDAVRWAMLDGSESLGMAGVLTVKGKQAKYKIRRVTAAEAKAE